MIIPTSPEEGSDIKSLFDKDDSQSSGASRYEPYRSLLPNEYYYDEPFEGDSDIMYPPVVDNSNTEYRPLPASLILRWDKLLGIRPTDPPPLASSPLATPSPEESQNLLNFDPFSTWVRFSRNSLPEVNSLDQNSSSDDYQIPREYPDTITTTRKPHPTGNPGGEDDTFLAMIEYTLSLEKLLIVLVTGFILGWIFSKFCSRRKRRCCAGGVPVGQAGVGGENGDQIQAPGGPPDPEQARDGARPSPAPSRLQNVREMPGQLPFLPPNIQPALHLSRPISGSRRSYLDHPRVIVPNGYGPIPIRTPTTTNQQQQRSSSVISSVTGRHVLRLGLRPEDFQNSEVIRPHYRDEEGQGQGT